MSLKDIYATYFNKFSLPKRMLYISKNTYNFGIVFLFDTSNCKLLRLYSLVFFEGLQFDTVDFSVLGEVFFIFWLDFLLITSNGKLLRLNFRIEHEFFPSTYLWTTYLPVIRCCTSRRWIFWNYWCFRFLIFRWSTISTTWFSCSSLF